jgi:biotin transport system substrate-specific component
MSAATLPTPPNSVLADHFWRGKSLTRSVALAIGGSLALAVSAKVQVPFWPVPMTMQSLVVLLLGVAYGSRIGAAAVLVYLAEGLAGLPVFAGASAGPAYMTGPTAGYLLGFVLAAMSLGHALLFVPGVLWLAVLFGWTKAIATGLTPFIAATVVKTALAVAIVAACWSAVGSSGTSARR